MILYLMRHGEATSNLDLGVYNSTPNEEIPLTENGKKQAEEVSKKIKEHYDRSYIEPSHLYGKNIARKGIHPVLIFSSPYKRAIETAEPIKKEFHFHRFYINPLLVEQNFGIGTGAASLEEFVENPTIGEFGTLESARLTKNNASKIQKQVLFKCGKFFMKLPQGESRCDVAMRAEIFLQKIRNYAVDSVVIICHKGVCEMMHYVITGNNEENWQNAEVRIYENSDEFGMFKEIGRL